MNQLQVQGGAPISLRAAAALSDAYVASTAIDLKSYDSVALMIALSAADSGKTMTMKYDWSSDDVDASADVTNWYSETVEDPGTASGAELPYASYIKTTTVLLTNAQSPCIRLRRMGRWFRVQVKGSAATTATIAITAKPMCNEN